MTSERAALREKVAKAICTADEQNGGPPWDYVQTMGKHVVSGLYDRADAAIDMVLEEAARVAEDTDVSTSGQATMRYNIAAAIRAMKGTPTSPESAAPVADQSPATR
jgi:hypothetical protein